MYVAVLGFEMQSFTTRAIYIIWVPFFNKRGKICERKKSTKCQMKEQNIVFLEERIVNTRKKQHGRKYLYRKCSFE